MPARTAAITSGRFIAGERITEEPDGYLKVSLKFPGNDRLGVAERRLSATSEAPPAVPVSGHRSSPPS
jgi:hypothetical protein